MEPAPADCESVAAWPTEDAQREESLLIAINSVRSSGSACGNTGVFPPVLTMQPELRCAARLHVLDMIERGYFAKNTPEGATPEDRIAATGYVFSAAGEDLWTGTQEEVVQQTLSGEGDCSNVANTQFESAGVGHAGDYWVVDFTGP